jgi:hypothetical protein
VRWSIDYALDLMQSLYAAKLRRETLLFLRLLATDDTELLIANLVQHVGTTKRSALMPETDA